MIKRKLLLKKIIMSSFVILLCLAYASIASLQTYAISDKQRDLYRQNILYYDLDVSECSAVEASAAGARGSKVIVIDPGHGIEGTETDPESGIIATETSGSSGERAAMWEASQIVKKNLEEAGYKVVMTKSSETDPAGLITKSKIANDANADLAVSLHYTDGTFGTPNGAWGVTPQEVGRFRENKSNGKRKTFTDEALAAKSKQYAQIVADERTKTGDKANVAALTGSFPKSRSDIKAWGDISIVQLFATVPWVYNEVGRTGFSTEKYAEGITNGIKRAIPINSGGGSGEAAATASGDESQGNCSCNNEPSGPVSANGTSDGTLEGFVEAYGQAAFSVGKRYGIPYEAILAQAALESGWGKSDLAAKDNNFFGIKADERWEGETVTYSTREDNPPRTIQAAFRKYPSAEAGFTGYASFIHHNERYKDALKYPGDPVQYITELKKAGYATANDYISANVTVQNNIIKYIRDKNLFPPSSSVQSDGQVPPDQNSASTGGSSGSGGCGGNSEGAQSVVEIAKREYEKNKGIREYGGTILEYTDGNQEAWCADFVSWVYKEAGMPFTDGLGNDPKGWRQAGVVNLQTWFKQKQVYFAVGDQKPQPGDVAFYIGAQTPDGGSGEHVNIVIEVNGDTMTTIGGNQSDQVTQRDQQIKLDASGLVGFGRLK